LVIGHRITGRNSFYAIPSGISSRQTAWFGALAVGRQEMSMIWIIAPRTPCLRRSDAMFLAAGAAVLAGDSAVAHAHRAAHRPVNARNPVLYC
jgi:hypothetical protein